MNKKLLLCKLCRCELDSSLFYPSKPDHCKSCLKKNKKDWSSTHPSKITCKSCDTEKDIVDYPKKNLKNKRPNCKDCHYKRRYLLRKRRHEKDPIQREKYAISKRIGKSLKKKMYDKDSIAANYLCCSKQEFVEHLESQFRDGMSWENREEWHIDHVIPLARAKTQTEIKSLWHYTNLRPMWGPDNIAKGDS